MLEKIQAMQEKSAEKSLSKELILPHCPTKLRGTPNSFLRSALFSAIQSKDRQFVKDELVASQDGINILYTGEQLNQEDLTLWEALVHLAKETPLGTSCEFTAYEILKELKLYTGGEQHKQLEAGITRLSSGTVKIRHNGKKYFGSLIQSGVITEQTDHYMITLDRQLFGLYLQSTWVNWEQRLQIRRKPLAQALHGYYSSHKVPYPVKLETLQKYTGSRNKQKASFKRQTISALDELVTLGFLLSYTIDGDLVSVKKTSG